MNPDPLLGSKKRPKRSEQWLHTREHSPKTWPSGKGHPHRPTESQETFWSRFGISQSCGSRFENGENLPFPIYLLLHFYIEGQITDRQLADLRGKIRE
ncbi:regulatory protein RsaL [Pseudomonas aeruginosa]|nr:regulatory protein RsaL [Pseudomonas aeruginosa]